MVEGKSQTKTFMPCVLATPTLKIDLVGETDMCAGSVHDVGEITVSKVVPCPASASTAWPAAHSTATTRASDSAWISFCIFIASSTRSVVPGETRSPALTRTSTTRPGIRARISAAERRARGGAVRHRVAGAGGDRQCAHQRALSAQAIAGLHIDGVAGAVEALDQVVATVARDVVVAVPGLDLVEIPQQVVSGYEGMLAEAERIVGELRR